MFISKIEAWLKQPVSCFRLVAYGVLGCFFYLGWCYVLLGWWGYHPNSSRTGNVVIKPVILILYGAMIEEILFRWIPFGICFDNLSARHHMRASVLVYILVSVCFFGYLHGDMSNIALQGVAGGIFGALYLKASEFTLRPTKGLIASTLCHAGVNLSLKTAALL